MMAVIVQSRGPAVRQAESMYSGHTRMRKCACRAILVVRGV
jgi:hypothetical protein